ncbi:MAG: ribosome small subunit-dependent GTPase A [Verrucomicrobiota bacterium]
MTDPTRSLAALGWDAEWESRFRDVAGDALIPARVAVEDKHHYVVLHEGGELLARVKGSLLHDLDSPELPKVGDWVSIRKLPNEEKALIHHVLPRRTRLSRKSAGRRSAEQVLVANVDIAFAVQALDDSFNPPLLQRHLAMALDGGVKPVVVLNKTDLSGDILDKMARVEEIAGKAPVLAVSARTGRAMDSLSQLIRPGETVVFIGPSGVGKSSLINQLYGEEIQATTEIRETDAKGRHTTTWRELIVLPGGGLVIDTPGMREFHLWLAADAGGGAFEDVEALALQCHFRSCTHTVEKRCAVLSAVESGGLPRERYDQYLKLRREREFLQESTRRAGYLRRPPRRSPRPHGGKYG